MKSNFGYSNNISKQKRKLKEETIIEPYFIPTLKNPL